jgi:hypothetical protein
VSAEIEQLEPKPLTNIHHKLIEVTSRGDFVRIKMEDPPALTVWAALVLAGQLIDKAYRSSIRYGYDVDADYLAKCFRDAGFEAGPDTTLRDLIEQLEGQEEREG